MARLFRGMKEDADGCPEVGESARTLGVRPGIDVPAKDPGDFVHPGQGGLSVGPDDPLNLPAHRRPPPFGGTGRDPVWVLDAGDLGPDLRYRPDLLRSGHGFVEPVRPMTLGEYQQALARTRRLWRKCGLVTRGRG
jgi:hypothetical protein